MALFPIQKTTPTLYPGCVLWLDSQNINNTDPATQPANAASVASYKSRSGYRQDYAQLTGAKQPTYQVSGANSKPCLRFNGISNKLDSGSGFNADLSPYLSMFLVLTPSSTNAAFALGTKGTLGDAPAIICNYNPGSGVKQFELWELSNRYTIKASGANAGLNIISVIRDGNGGAGSLKGYFNAVESFNTTAAFMYSGTIFNEIGAPINPNYYGGDLAEIIIYNSLLTNSQRQQVESYLANKWGISI